MLAVEDRLAISVDGPNGPLARWADDEADAERIPDDLQISKSLPGGDKQLRCSLLGDPRLDRPDARQLNEIRAYGPGNETVWRGFLSSDEEGSDRRNPAAAGDAARFQDDPAIPFRIVDRDLTAWRGQSRAWKLADLANGYSPQDGSVEQDATTGLAALRLSFQGAWAAGGLPESTLVYDGGAAGAVGRISCAWAAAGGTSSAAPFAHRIYAMDTDDGAGTIDVLAVNPTLPGTVDIPLATARRFLAVQLRHDAGPAGAAGVDYSAFLTKLAVCGDTDIPLQSTGGAPGVFGGDVWRYLLDQHRAQGGPVRYTDDSIDSGSDFVIPHLVGEGPVSVEEGAEAIGRFYEHEWAVYDRTALWLPRKSFGRLWFVRRDEGARPEGAGYSEDHLFNGALITYTDPSGATRTVGPAGSGFDPFAGSNAGLLITDEENVLNQWGRRRWARLTAPMTTELGALRLGERFTQAIQTRQLSGSLTVENGMLMDPAGARYPAWAANPGDRVVVLGSGDSTERFIVATDYTHKDRTSRLTLDSAPEDLGSTLERLQVVLVGAVT